MAEDKDKGLTWPQIRYWGTCFALVVVGVAATTWGGPWETSRPFVKELGPGVFTAGILAALVEPFFRKEFARDAFVAAFRYVLPKEFKDEIGKILRNEFIAERQTWRIEIARVNNDIVAVTTSFERVLTNKTSTTQKKGGLYTVPEFCFPCGNTEIIECGVKSGSETIEEFERVNDRNIIRATTKEVDVLPGKTAIVWGKAVQYRRANDAVYETFGTPAVDPEIEVVIPDDMLHVFEFGTVGDVEESRFSKKYKLRGVYFPGQYMLVRWWPKPQEHLAAQPSGINGSKGSV